MGAEEEFALDDDLIEVVLGEARESLDEAVRLLDADATAPSAVGALFRCFHSIKGNTAMVRRLDVSKSAHLIEDYLDQVRSAGRGLRPDEQEGLLELVDILSDAIETENSPALGPLPEIVARLAAQVGRVEPVEPRSGDPVAPAVANRGAEGDEAANKGGDRDVNVLRVDASALFDTLEVAGKLFQIDERLKYFVNQARQQQGAASVEVRGLGQLEREFDTEVEKLYELLLDIQRLPVTQLSTPLERALRDICRATKKEIALETEGRDLRIDKQILQTLRDPLMHMVRNSADHGVELPADRLRLGKPRQATVRLIVEDLDDFVRVTLSDNGAGVRLDKVKQRAVERGLVSEAEAANLTTEQIVEFIFQAGFSTAEKVSDLSGRGVGMDVVVQQLRAAGGRLRTTTVPGQGTTFILEIPKPGSPVLDGLAVRRGDTVHIVALKHVRSFVGRCDMRLTCRSDGQVMARVGEAHYAVVHAPGDSSSLGLEDPRTIGVLIEPAGGEAVLMPVDDVLGRRRALLQSVEMGGEEVSPQRACILGDGTMAFALDVQALAREPELVFRVAHGQDLGQGLERDEQGEVAA